MNFSRKKGLLALAAFLLLIEVGCGDQYRPVANPIISPGGQPQTLHYAWVLNFNPNGAGSVTKIDVSGDTNLAVNAMGSGSIAEGFPGGVLSLFVANRDNDTVSQFFPTLSTTITTISLPAQSRPVWVSAAQPSFMYVLNSSSAADSDCMGSGSVSTIPTASLSVSNTTCVGPSPTTMVQSSSNSKIFILNGDSSITIFDPGAPGVTGTITSQNGLNVGPVGLAASNDGKWIFVVTQGDGVSPGMLDIVDAGVTCVPAMPCVAASVPLGVRPMFSLADPTLNRLYVTNSGDNTVSVFDISNVTPSGSPPIPLLATVPVGTGPVGVTALQDGSRFYVANATSNDVTVVSANSFSVLSTVPLPAGANPVWIASDPTSRKVYVADQGTSATTIIQTSNNGIVGNIAAPQQDSSCTSSCALQQPVMILSR